MVKKRCARSMCSVIRYLCVDNKVLQVLILKWLSRQGERKMITYKTLKKS